MGRPRLFKKSATLSISLDADRKAKLIRLARKQGLSASKILLDLLDRKLIEEAAKP